MVGRIANATLSFPEGVDITLGILGILVVVSAALAVSRASLVKAQLEALRGDRDDLQARADRLEEEGKEKDDKITKLESKVEILEHVVTGKEQLDVIISTLHSLLQSGSRVETSLAELISTERWGRPPRPMPPTGRG